ncbi:PspC domain-containing protein [Lactiplantibacillus mudanjiangensis]|uniref:PspC domain-containing protein [Lactobacillus pentosus] n=1 Tax=Lactiplantibacillus mudanjiangensis TaxID=1296538 RepID=A0A660E1L3_9LACO|nr:PspC domain-containing protein [Lactiplantibacillus mudanjiangensis]VDG21015.1 PspC domain-containing protein [Lactobacillus pentosus] [Lactiplantibacillus mudanjiangensis]VDG22798.1 PspC domain-containing protein [Lactobacillus pentosus] [Lactiplantibacillus mudanjiangensis]VDG26632.1 PspC domain-containing protein [Lactobacillus pentosus] [Lactiplantibacillus mudanjiangensis]VDG31864.1 PspC domain-containing protein [Lactobacillus pentosus] [Lactiplantibacillus mudanjiangensis]
MKINIHRSNNDRVIAGVIGGIAEHYDWNANLTRLIYVLLSLTPLPGLIIYLILWLLMKDPIEN